MQKLILDCDTGSDDAVAIMVAALHPELDLVAVTTVNGNVPVESCTENTLRLLDHVGVQVPVYEGASRPIARQDFPVPRSIHNLDTMHGPHLDLPEARSSRQHQHAVDFLIDFYLGPEGAATTLVPTGPLTNIAMAMTLRPEIIPRIPRIVLMGGGHEVGNMSPASEFNIWADPEAARIVIGSGAKDVVIVTLDCTHEAVVSAADCAGFAALGTPAGDAASMLISSRIRAQVEAHALCIPHTTAVHDAVCVAYLIEPGVLERTGRYYVDVETSGELCVGRTVIDTHYVMGKQPNATVALGGNKRLFVQLLTETFAGKSRSADKERDKQ